MSAIGTDAFVRPLRTPEGVELHLRLGDASQRFSALVIDVLVMAVALAALTLLSLAAGLGAARGGSTGGLEVIASILLLGFFLLRNFYFVVFELGPAAATPGKRLMGLRVASRDGGRLRAEAVFARNAMRELEMFLPLSVVSAASGAGSAEWPLWLAALVWVLVFALFPLFNRDRLRCGDLVAGTWVVRTPRQALAKDLSADAAVRRHAFTPAQVDVYGEAELAVLERVLRGGEAPTLAKVAERIARKIGWTETILDDQAFLADYYAALRGRLEGRMLLGRRRATKFDR